MKEKKDRPELEYGLLLDLAPDGARRLSVTRAGPSAKRNGRRLQTAGGKLFQNCCAHAATILWQRHGQTMLPPGENPKQYYPIGEHAATQIRLLMDAVAAARNRETAETLGRAVAGMHPCESGWWYAAHKNRNRPRRVMDALALMYA